MVNARSAWGAVIETMVLLRGSVLTWCGLDDAGPVTIGGVIPQANGSGYVWQVAAPVLASHKRAYLLQGRALLAEARGRFRMLATHIRVGFHAALRHARRMGFVAVREFDLVGARMCRLERGL